MNFVLEFNDEEINRMKSYSNNFDFGIKIYYDVLDRQPFSLFYKVYYDKKEYIQPFQSPSQLTSENTDQFATYSQNNCICTFCNESLYLTSIYGGPFNNINYINIVIGQENISSQTFFNFVGGSPRLQWFLDQVPIKNPYQNIGWTPNCFPSNHLSEFVLQQDKNDKINSIGLFSTINEDNKILVYRPSKDMTETRIPEEPYKVCILGYLISIPCNQTYTKNPFYYGIMRITIPDCYISTEHYQCLSSKETEHFDVYYSSVSSQNTPSEPYYPYWTVNMRMLHSISFTIHDQPYAYVFWAPRDQIPDFEKLTTAPIVEWGNKKGYLLPAPTYAFFFRYKQENPDWKGNTKNAPCALTVDTIRPVTVQLTDLDTKVNYCPQLYGQNFDSFMEFLSSPSIGPISNETEESWTV